MKNPHWAGAERWASGAMGSRSNVGAEQLSWLSRGPLYIFLALDLLSLPGRPMLQHGVEYSQKRMHTGRSRDFLHLPRGEQPLVKGFDPRVVTRGHTDQRRHLVPIEDPQTPGVL